MIAADFGPIDSTLSKDDGILHQPPFPAQYQLSRELDGPAHHVPSRPRVSLQDRDQVCGMLTQDFCNDDMDRAAKKLWWMSMQDSRNISPLHRQSVKGRKIVVTEDPKLHLVWIQDRIFIKPLPRYITSHAFWTKFLGGGGGPDAGQIRRAALGYLRTYYHLIQYESDFRIAQEPGLCLIPADITWEQFCSFTALLCHVKDEHVSLRYCYGEVRLTRLNFYAPLVLGKSHFQRVDYQYGQYFARFFTPAVFVFAIVAVILGALQVIVTVGDDPVSGLAKSAVLISVVAMAASCALLLTLAFLLAYKVVKEWQFAIRDRIRRQRHESEQV